MPLVFAMNYASESDHTYADRAFEQYEFPTRYGGSSARVNVSSTTEAAGAHTGRVRCRSTSAPVRWVRSIRAMRRSGSCVRSQTEGPFASRCHSSQANAISNPEATGEATTSLE